MKQGLLIVFGAALATTAVIKAAPALSEPLQAEAVSVVRTADLDLSTDSGRRQLDHRLVTAAHELCDTISNVDLSASNRAGQCRTDVLLQGRAKASALLASRSANREIRVAVAR